MNALAMRLLADADLQRAEAALAANLRSDELIDGGPAAPTPAVDRARDKTAHRFVMTIAGAGNARGRIIESADHVKILLKGSERRTARPYPVPSPRLDWNPITPCVTV